MVVFHAWALAAISPFGSVETMLGHIAEVSIQGFFIVSGALVFGSLERSRSLGLYAEKRVRRLYPAYAVIVFIPALVSALLTGLEAPVAILKYLGANLVFLNFLAPNLLGLFDVNRFTEVNGALWTLKIEVMFYLVLPVLALVMSWLGRARWGLLVLIYVSAEAWRAFIPRVLDHPAADQIARQLPGQMSFFVSGMAVWLLWAEAKRRPLVFGLVGVVLTALSCLHPALEPLRAAGLAGLVACAAFMPGPQLNAARFGDISYGVYITHFPILQALVMLGLVSAVGLAASFAVAVILVIAVSLVLWWMVEKPALRRDSHYRRVANDA